MTERVAFSRVDGNGGAAASTVQSNITASDVSFAIGAGEASSWPDGSAGKFMVCFGRGTAAEEKAWAASRSGTTVSFDDVGDRGADDTAAAAHVAGVAVEVVIGWDHIDESNKAVAEWLFKATTAGQIPYISAAQVVTMLSIGAAGRVLISSGTAPTWQPLTGDVTINSSGVTAIGASKITNAMMADDAIDSAEIADGAIDLIHMSANSVDSDQYVDGSIDTIHLGDDQVTLAKMAAAAKPRWSVNFGRDLLGASGTNLQIQRFAGSASTTLSYVVPEAAAVVGVSAYLGSIPSAGTATFKVYVNGVDSGLSCALNGSRSGYATQAETADAVVAGDVIDVRFSTTADWAATVSSVTVDVLLQAV